MSGEHYVLGIDLGTTNSCVAVYRDGKVEIIPNTEGCNITPSVVAFTSGRRLVGNEAKDQLAWNAENTVYGVKRLLGRTFDDPLLQNDIRMWPFSVVSVNEKPKIQVTDQGVQKTFHPEEISALVLSRMKEIAESYLHCKVTDAVITVPAYFDNNQRQATRAAGRIAGLNVLRLINEPTAAAIAYGLDKKDQHNVLVYDLGGGTFDVSILKMDSGSFEVKATKGDTHLGGEDFDNRMVDFFAKEIKDQYNKDIFQNKRAVRRLKNACEKAKVRLSSSNRVLLEDLPNLLPDVDFEPSIFRYQFEEMNLDFFKRTIDTVEEALNDAKMLRGEIQDVVLVGGSTRILKVQTMLKNFFRRDRLNRNINPDEAVAYGAAVQGAILSGNRPSNLEGIELYDVVPLSLGTDVIGGRMSVIIPRNTPIPTRKRSTYNTTSDNQTRMLVQVYEGEREFLKDNSYLGETVLTGIQPDPRGYATVDVIFEIDDDCILHVKARDRDTNREENLQIYNNAKKLSETQMQRLIQEAEANKLVDMMESVKITALNDLEFYMNDVRASCNSSAIELTSSQKALVLSKLDETRDWLNVKDHKLLREKDFKAKQKELEDIWNPIITYSINMKLSGRSSGKPILLGD